MRQVLDRLEDSKTGRLLPQSFHCEVPADRLAQAHATAAILGDEIYIKADLPIPSRKRAFSSTSRWVAPAMR